MPKRADSPPKTPAKSRWILWGRVMLWSTAFAGLAWGGKEVQSFLMRDPRFRFENLEVKGIRYTNPARVRAVFASDLGRSVFQVPLAERRRHLLAVDWVRSAALSRVWPDRVVVTIDERIPVAFAKLPIAGSIRHWMALIDADGVLLTIPSRVRFRLPVLSGISEEQSDEERRMRVQLMQHLLGDLGPQAKDIFEVDAASTRDLRVVAEAGGRAVELVLGDQHYRARYLNFVNHYEEIRRHSENASLFDLRIDDRISAR